MSVTTVVDANEDSESVSITVEGSDNRSPTVTDENYDTVFVTITDEERPLELNQNGSTVAVKDANKSSNDDDIVIIDNTAMQTSDENGKVTSSTDTPSVDQINELVFVSETRPNDNTSTNSLLDLTMIDYVKSELMRNSASIIEDITSQFLGVLKCNRCSYNTRFLSNIRKHVITHFSEPKKNEHYFCVLCNNVKKGLYNFLNHMRNVHTYTFYTPFYWCVKCECILREVKQLPSHNCPKRSAQVKIFKSNGTVFCMACKFESSNVNEVKQHVKICSLKTSDLQPTETIEINDDD